MQVSFEIVTNELNLELNVSETHGLWSDVHSYKNEGDTRQKQGKRVLRGQGAKNLEKYYLHSVSESPKYSQKPCVRLPISCRVPNNFHPISIYWSTSMFPVLVYRGKKNNYQGPCSHRTQSWEGETDNSHKTDIHHQDSERHQKENPTGESVRGRQK
jgi:hypothetical protein